MITRSDPDLVKGVLGRNYDKRVELQPFCQAAAMLVGRVEGIVEAGTFTEEELTLLETWLAAHFYQASDPGWASRSTSGRSGSREGQTGMHLELTRYGQMAMDLDTTNTLRDINAGNGEVEVQCFSNHTPASEVRSFHERNY